MAGRRHAPAEIDSKLQRADELAAEGKTQREIIHALNVSLMTLHRWRRSRLSLPGMQRKGRDADQPVSSRLRIMQTPTQSRLDELKLENERLRRLVTDLLLEKINLEDQLRSKV